MYLFIYLKKKRIYFKFKWLSLAFRTLQVQLAAFFFFVPVIFFLALFKQFPVNPSSLERQNLWPAVSSRQGCD